MLLMKSHLNNILQPPACNYPSNHRIIFFFKSSISFSKLLYEDPLGLAESWANFENRSMDPVISSLLCFIRVFIIITMVDLSHMSFISSPIFLHLSLTRLLLSWWSPNTGQQIIGTPASMLSRTEFQTL